jgi:hypothetical protein
VLPDLEKLFLRSPGIRVTSERRLEPAEIPEVVAFPYVYEQFTTGGRASGYSRYVAGTADHVVFFVACSGAVGSWPWSDVASVAGAQAARVRAVLEATSS